MVCYMEQVVFRNAQIAVELARFVGLSAAGDLRMLSHKMSGTFMEVKDAVLAAFPQRFCVVGGGGEDRSKGDLYSAEYYDSESNQWRQLPGMNVRRYGPGVCSSRGKLYALGGDVYGPWERRSVERLNPLLGKWEILAKMNQCHTETVPVALGHYIYVCGGGFDFYDNSAERYSVIENRWEQLPNMPCSRNDGTAVVWNNQVLMVAGRNPEDPDEMAVSKCASFDPGKNFWQYAMKLQTPREGAACAVLDGALYVCGGNASEFSVEDEQRASDMPEALCTVERYVFADGTWETLPPMLEARYAAAAAAVGGQLYVAGGANGTQRLSSAERFDPVTNAWSSLPAMSTVRVRPGAAAIREVVDKPLVQEEEVVKCTYKQSKSRRDPLSASLHNERAKRGLEVGEFRSQLVVRDKYGEKTNQPWRREWYPDFELNVPEDNFPVTIYIIPEPPKLNDYDETQSGNEEEDSEEEFDSECDFCDTCHCGRPAAEELGGTECWSCYDEH